VKAVHRMPRRAGILAKARRSQTAAIKEEPNPTHLTPHVRRELRTRALDRCEDCDRPLASRRETWHPPKYDDRIRVLVYEGYRCWRCGKPGPVVRVEPNASERQWEEIHSRFPTVYKDYSKTVLHRYWANHCGACGALQGDYFVLEGTFDLEPASVWEIPVDRYLVEPGWLETKRVAWGNIHHLDRNPSNNALANLRLLCVRCHRNRHGALKQSESPS